MFGKLKWKICDSTTLRKDSDLPSRFMFNLCLTFRTVRSIYEQHNRPTRRYVWRLAEFKAGSFTNEAENGSIMFSIRNMQRDLCEEVIENSISE